MLVDAADEVGECGPESGGRVAALTWAAPGARRRGSGLGAAGGGRGAGRRIAHVRLRGSHAEVRFRLGGGGGCRVRLAGGVRERRLAGGLVAGARARTGLGDAALEVGARLARRLTAGLERLARGLDAAGHLGAHAVDGVGHAGLQVAHGLLRAVAQALDARAELVARLLAGAGREEERGARAHGRAQQKGADAAAPALDDDVGQIILVGHLGLLIRRERALPCTSSAARADPSP